MRLTLPVIQGPMNERPAKTFYRKRIEGIKITSRLNNYCNAQIIMRILRDITVFAMFAQPFIC